MNIIGLKMCLLIKWSIIIEKIEEYRNVIFPESIVNVLLPWIL